MAAVRWASIISFGPALADGAHSEWVRSLTPGQASGGNHRMLFPAAHDFALREGS